MVVRDAPLWFSVQHLLQLSNSGWILAGLHQAPPVAIQVVQFLGVQLHRPSKRGEGLFDVASLGVKFAPGQVQIGPLGISRQGGFQMLGAPLPLPLRLVQLSQGQMIIGLLGIERHCPLIVLAGTAQVAQLPLNEAQLSMEGRLLGLEGNCLGGLCSRFIQLP